MVVSFRHLFLPTFLGSNMAVSNFLSRQSIINQAVIAARLSATVDVKAEKYSGHC